MSRSYRTQKESVIAERRVERGADGNVVLPRVVERQPASGDIHPLSKRTLTRLLQKLPVEYLYGLSRIELRARQGSEIGHLYGCYWKDERAIVLYSLPTVWRLRGISKNFARSLTRFYADFKFEEEVVVVSWRDEAVMGLWFYCDVFTHELGHHFVEQYQNRNGRVQGRRFEEFVANLQARRFTEEVFARYKSKGTLANKTVQRTGASHSDRSTNRTLSAAGSRR
jgi:hypothetical protein